MGGRINPPVRTRYEKGLAGRGLTTASRRTISLDCIRTDRTWHHSDVISGQPMLGTKFFFAHRMSIDVLKCAESYVLIDLHWFGRYCEKTGGGL